MSATDSRLKLLKIAVIRAGIRIPAQPDDDIVWLSENGYLEPFEDANGTPCYRASSKAHRALDVGSLEIAAKDRLAG